MAGFQPFLMTSRWSLRPTAVWCGLVLMTFVDPLVSCKSESQCASVHASQKYAVAFLGGHAGWVSHTDLTGREEEMNFSGHSRGQCLRVRGRQPDVSVDQVTLSYKEVKNVENGRTSNGSKAGTTKQKTRKFKGSKNQRKKEKKKKKRNKKRRTKN